MLHAVPPAPSTAVALPILITATFAATVGQYRRLGFVTVYADSAYAILRLGPVELHLTQVSAVPQPPCVATYIRCEDVDAWHQAMTATGEPGVSEVADRPWGMREFYFLDSAGNLLKFGQSIPGAGPESEPDC